MTSDHSDCPEEHEYVIEILARANGKPLYRPAYVQVGDPEFYLVGCGDGGVRGLVVMTDAIEKAKAFASVVEANRWYHTRSQSVPTRPDGQPNLPFTAYTIEIVPVHVQRVSGVDGVIGRG